MLREASRGPGSQAAAMVDDPGGGKLCGGAEVFIIAGLYGASRRSGRGARFGKPAAAWYNSRVVSPHRLAAQDATLSRWRSRVRIPLGVPEPKRKALAIGPAPIREPGAQFLVVLGNVARHDEDNEPN